MITQWKQQTVDTIGSIGKLILKVICRRRGLLEKVSHQHLRRKLGSLLDHAEDDMIRLLIWLSMEVLRLVMLYSRVQYVCTGHGQAHGTKRNNWAPYPKSI